MNKASLNIFRFERIRQGKKMRTSSGERIGTYLYRDITNNTLLASWNEPTKGDNYLYKGEDIGYNTDALIYKK